MMERYYPIAQIQIENEGVLMHSKVEVKQKRETENELYTPRYLAESLQLSNYLL